jgi:hypothetical protein
MSSLTVMLLAQQTPVALPERQDPTSLEFIKAAEEGNLEKLRSVGPRSNIAGVGEDSRTALLAAGQRGNRAAFAEIIAIVNDIVKKQVARLPKEGQPAVAPSMIALQNRIDLFNRADSNGTTPLMLAASRGWDDLAYALVEGGATSDTRDRYGSSAAAYAEAAGSIELADFLYKAATTIP